MAVNAVDAATVVLLRDQGKGYLETLLMRRPTAARAFPGVFVFPGGKVEWSDQQLSPSRWSSARDLRWWREELDAATEDAALGYLVAAIRETFEEAGVLFAQHSDGRPVGKHYLDRPSVMAARAGLSTHNTACDWSAWLSSEGLVLDFDALRFWSWWVTPRTSPYRFDTRFFVARQPDDQVARVDQQELTEIRWLPPRDALEGFADRSLPLLNPTARTIELLAEFESTEEALCAAASGRVDRRRNGPPAVVTDSPDGRSAGQCSQAPPG